VIIQWIRVFNHKKNAATAYVVERNHSMTVELCNSLDTSAYKTAALIWQYIVWSGWSCVVDFHNSVALPEVSREREAEGKVTGSLLEIGDIFISNIMLMVKKANYHNRKYILKLDFCFNR